jgi:hypothetical protein
VSRKFSRRSLMQLTGAAGVMSVLTPQVTRAATSWPINVTAEGIPKICAYKATLPLRTVRFSRSGVSRDWSWWRRNAVD